MHDSRMKQLALIIVLALAPLSWGGGGCLLMRWRTQL